MHHAHKLTSDDELQRKVSPSRKEVAKIMRFPGDDVQGRRGRRTDGSVPLALRFAGENPTGGIPGRHLRVVARTSKGC